MHIEKLIPIQPNGQLFLGVEIAKYMLQQNNLGDHKCDMDALQTWSKSTFLLKMTPELQSNKGPELLSNKGRDHSKL